MNGGGFWTLRLSSFVNNANENKPRSNWAMVRYSTASFFNVTLVGEDQTILLRDSTTLHSYCSESINDSNIFELSGCLRFG